MDAEAAHQLAQSSSEAAVNTLELENKSLKRQVDELVLMQARNLVRSLGVVDIGTQVSDDMLERETDTEEGDFGRKEINEGDSDEFGVIEIEKKGETEEENGKIDEGQCDVEAATDEDVRSSKDKDDAGSSCAEDVIKGQIFEKEVTAVQLKEALERHKHDLNDLLRLPQKKNKIPSRQEKAKHVARVLLHLAFDLDPRTNQVKNKAVFSKYGMTKDKMDPHRLIFNRSLINEITDYVQVNLEPNSKKAVEWTRVAISELAKDARRFVRGKTKRPTAYGFPRSHRYLTMKDQQILEEQGEDALKALAAEMVRAEQKTKPELSTNWSFKRRVKKPRTLPKGIKNEFDLFDTT